jgi:hypothetical protein
VRGEAAGGQPRHRLERAGIAMVPSIVPSGSAILTSRSMA